MVTGLEVWYFRKDGSAFDPHTVYADHPEVFSMKLFHGGTFTPTPNRRYFGGKVQYIDLLDIEQFTITIIHSIVKMLKYDTRDIMYYHFKIPDKNLDWGLRALASDDDIVYLSKFVKDNKVIEVYIEHGETTVESYYMPTFTEKLQLKELNNNDEVVELDEELPIVPHTRKRKFLGIPKCRKTLAIEWLSNDQVGQHSGLGGAENASGEDNAASGDENEASGEDHAASGDENYATADENDNVDGVEDIVDDGHIIDQVDANMEGFRFTANSDERDTIRPQVNINEDDLEVIDYDEFKSELDEDDIGSTRRAALKKLRKKGNANNENGIVNHFFLGQEFCNREEVKERIKAYSVESRRNVEIVKNDNVRVRARCVGIVPSMDDETMESSIGKRSDKGNHVKHKDSYTAKKGKNEISEVVDDKYKCQWSMYVAKAENGKFLVRTLNKEHICLHSRKAKHCTSTFLSKHVTDLVHLNPEIPIKALQDQMQKQFQVGISKHKAFKAKAKAEETLKGDAELQYGVLRDYVMELQKCNPNTTVKIDVYMDEDADSNTKKFRRIYVCLGALKDGFKAGGRDLIDSWLWFLFALGDDLDLHINSNFTFITDRQKDCYLQSRDYFHLLNIGRAHCDMLINNICEVFNSFQRRDQLSHVAIARENGTTKEVVRLMLGGRAAGASGSQATSVIATQQEPAASQQGAVATQGAASSANPFKRTKSTACRLTPTK
ncbi:O-fucosyltransferase family protein [Tanacetum coccineum]